MLRVRVHVLKGLEYRYEPGDVAVIHPEALPGDVESLLTCIGYANTADDPIQIHHTLEGTYTAFPHISYIIHNQLQTSPYLTIYPPSRLCGRYSLAMSISTRSHDARSSRC